MGIDDRLKMSHWGVLSARAAIANAISTPPGVRVRGDTITLDKVLVRLPVIA